MDPVPFEDEWNVQHSGAGFYVEKSEGQGAVLSLGHPVCCQPDPEGEAVTRLEIVQNSLGKPGTVMPPQTDDRFGRHHRIIGRNNFV